MKNKTKPKKGQRADYNKTRSDRYKNEPDYRKQVKNRERRRYAEANPNFVPKDYGKFAGKAVGFSVEFYLNKSLIMALGITEAAIVLNIKDKVLREWIKTNKFPAPQLKVDGGRRVYRVEEVDAMAAILKEKLAGRGSYRPQDTTTIREVHAAFKKLQ